MLPFMPEDHEDPKLGLVAEILRRRGTVRLKAWGTSMLPSVWPGDLLTIQSAGFDEVVLGDIVLGLRNNRFFVHRLVERRRVEGCLSWITRGDAMFQNDPPTAASDLLGRVVRIRRAHRSFVPSRRVSQFHSARAWTLRRWDRFRNLTLRVHSEHLRAGRRRAARFFRGVLAALRGIPGIFSIGYFSSLTTTLPTIAHEAVSIEIGGIAIALRTHDPSFRQLIERRYAGFVGTSPGSHFQFDIDLCEPSESAPGDDELEVTIEAGEWLLRRGDFRARWNPESGHGRIRQSRSPYALDSLLRIVHTLVLARQGGFLVHAASAIRDGKAFLFFGVSGAGKTTISRLAPPDATLLTDEISYVRREGNRYLACGTPFAGELARLGENQSAPLSALFFLEKGLQNKIEPVGATEAVQRLLRNVLFFADDPELVKLVFQAACEFASLVPIRRLVFVPDQRVWDIIR